MMAVTVLAFFLAVPAGAIALESSAPGIVSLSPAEGMTINTAGTKISFTASDPDLISNTGYYIKLNGTLLNSVLQYRGVWQDDSCGGSYYVITGYDQATITGSASGLKDGVQQVEVMVTDRKGNPAVKTWTFNAAVKPVFSGMSPANGVITANSTNVSVKVTDDTSVDPASIILTVDGIPVQHAFDQVTGVVSYTATAPLLNGAHIIGIQAGDLAGNVFDFAWSYIVQTTGPAVSSLAPAQGATVEATSATISFTVNDPNLIADTGFYIKVNGKAVSSGIQYPSHWVEDTCNGGYWVIDRYDQATITGTVTGLGDGQQVVEVMAMDKLGNKEVKTWTFNVAVGPKFTEMSPANNAETAAIPGISVKVRDANNAVNPGSIVLKINDVTVAHGFDPVTGIISYTGNLAEGKYTANVSASDEAGNQGSSAWSFTVDTTPPVVKVYPVYSSGVNGQYTEFRDGMAITDGKLGFRAELTDKVDISPDTRLALDGVPLNAQIRYEGFTDSCTGNWLVTSKKKVHVSYDGIITDGPHKLTLTGRDILGNTATYSWTLNVESKPVISEWKPVTYLSELSPVISAKVADINTGIDPSLVIMTLNGQTVAHSYNPVTGLVSYTPAGALENESYHTVFLRVSDLGGLVTETSWKFYVSTYPDMADSNMVNCSSCHSYDPNSAIPFQNVHKKISFYGSHSSNRCDACHTYITYPADCLQCHGDEGGGDDAPHGSSPGIKYGLKNYDRTFPVRVTQNREMWDCIICHQPGSPVKGWYWGYTQPNRVLNNHDIPELHKVPESGCNECHARSLTREHARNGRTDNSGNPVNCNTCHLSAETAVKNAIVGGDKNCTSCHSVADHQEMHDSGLDSNCQTCHSGSLTTEHIGNSTTAGNNYSCDTCHANTGKAVKRTIAADNRNCSGCHQQGHNLFFLGKVPEDIPLYTGFRWTTVMEASVFMGDPGFPAGYDTGQVVMSDRRSDLTADGIWSFYNEQLAANGWTLVSQAPPAGVQVFTAEFMKGSRYLTVRGYNTVNAEGSGAINSSGYRIEIWYR